MDPRVWTRCSEDLKKKSLSKSRCSCATGMTRGVSDAVQNESVGASRLSLWVTLGPLLIPPFSAGQMFPIISYARNLLLPRQQPEKGLPARGRNNGASRFRTGLLIDSLALSDAIYRHGNPLRLPSPYLLY